MIRPSMAALDRHPGHRDSETRRFFESIRIHRSRASHKGKSPRRQGLSPATVPSRVFFNCIASAAVAWFFDAKGYAESGDLAEELKAVAATEGLSIHEQDGRLFCYPALLRILPSDPAVEIGRKKLRTVRPSYVVGRLKILRMRPQRFRPEQFLEVLFRAHEWARRAESGGMRRLAGRGPVIELVSLFDLLTLFPDTQKEYGRLEFTRDLYLLDRSRVAETRAGATLELSASTGTKGAASRLLQIVGEDGVPTVYYGISFSGVGR